MMHTYGNDACFKVYIERVMEGEMVPSDSRPVKWKHILLAVFIIVSATTLLTDTAAPHTTPTELAVWNNSISSNELYVGADAPMAGAPIQPRSPMHILPLGDSITQAFGNNRSYRYYLWVKLINAGINFKFIGSMHSNFGGNPIWPPYRGHFFDNTHEGHAGWRTDQILDGFTGHDSERLMTWLQGYTPDVVLLHLGTNDAYQDKDNSSTENNLKQIIFELRIRNPNVIILLAKLIPTGFPRVNPLIDALNVAIDDIAREMDTPASPVIVVDQHAGFDPKTDTYDGIHPNKLGEKKMAKKWFQAIKALIDRGLYPPERTRVAEKDSRT